MKTKEEITKMIQNSVRSVYSSCHNNIWIKCLEINTDLTKKLSYVNLQKLVLEDAQLLVRQTGIDFMISFYVERMLND